MAFRHPRERPLYEKLRGEGGRNINDHKSKVEFKSRKKKESIFRKAAPPVLDGRVRARIS